MGILSPLTGPATNLLKKVLEQLEFKNFKEAVKHNPHDHGLRVRFAKYCLRHYFNHQAAAQSHLLEAVKLYDHISKADIFDLELFYLMGKYYHGQDNDKAIEVYRQGIHKFNDYIQRNPGLKHEYVELAFGIAMNLLSLESSKPDPELEQFFKTVRKTYLRRFLLEREAKAEGASNMSKAGFGNADVEPAVN